MNPRAAKFQEAVNAAASLLGWLLFFYGVAVLAFILTRWT